MPSPGEKTPLPELEGRTVLDVGARGGFAALDPAQLGRFDVVLFLGILHHLGDPLGAIRRLHALCDGVAVIETEAMALGGHPDACLWKFKAHHPASGWVPTRAGLEGICRAAGFGRIEHHGAPVPDAAPGTSVAYRAVVHAWR